MTMRPEGRGFSEPAVPLPDITNWCLVGRRGDGQISIGNPPWLMPMSADEALVLAAWLVVVADDDRGRFADILGAVQKT